MPLPEIRSRPGILFVGDIGSTHAQNWMALVDEAFDIHAFSFPGRPPANLNIPTVIPFDLALAPANPLHSAPGRRTLRFRRLLEAVKFGKAFDWLTPALRKTVARVQPDIIHTFGLEPAGALIAAMRDSDVSFSKPRWVAQLRGGSDLELRKFDADEMRAAVKILQSADVIVSDNLRNFRYLADAGIDPKHFASISPVPGSGGIDLEAIAASTDPASGRRVILWPKAYNTPYMQALPILEALRMAWPRLQPCRLVVLWATQSEVRDWIRAVCSELAVSWDVRDRVGRDEVFTLLRQSRVMLAPSLVDGVPNMLYEAMATGVLPIVSPLGTISDVVKDRENVLFARNLHPQEIADALIEAMDDDVLVDRIAETNRARVYELADRAQIRLKVRAFYSQIYGSK